MKDPDNKVADLYDAKRTPEIFVVDPDGKLRYHGRIDENYEDALEGHLAGPEERARRDPGRQARREGRDEGLRLHDQEGRRLRRSDRETPRACRTRGRSCAALAFFVARATVGRGGRPVAASPARSTRRGSRRRIAREKGRVVLVNFWATWCVPCREEFPVLSRLQKRTAAGLSVLGVSTDFEKEMPAVEKFLVEQKPSFPNYRKKSGGDDQDFIEAVDSTWGGELPFSVLYDRSGRKVRVLSGELEIAAVEKQIVSLLAARAPAPR